MKTTTHIQDVFPQTDIVVFCPHFDDFLFTVGGWAQRMKEAGLLGTKRFHAVVLFSRSNYTAHAGDAIFDTGLERVKYATGQRVIEDMECLDELLGPRGYEYRLCGMRECFARGKAMRGDSEMEYPWGVFETFDEGDWALFGAVQSVVASYAAMPDAALVFPLAIREHVVHFIVREAGLKLAKERGAGVRASFYFHEDKPYSGHADAAEWARAERFIAENGLKEIVYGTNPGAVVDLAFRHYVSQVDDTYRDGVLGRAQALQCQYGADAPLDRVFRYDTIRSL
jgi:hypothetical protein